MMRVLIYEKISPPAARRPSSVRAPFSFVVSFQGQGKVRPRVSVEHLLPLDILSLLFDGFNGLIENYFGIGSPRHGRVDFLYKFAKINGYYRRKNEKKEQTLQKFFRQFERAVKREIRVSLS